MELVIGGAFQGKKKAAEQLFGLTEQEILNGSLCEPEALVRAKAVENFHMLIRRLMEQGESPEQYYEKLAAENPGIILISNEIGYGIVPLDRFEREWREKTGRICCLAAAKAEHVIRVLAGIPIYIKGEQK